jgi:hypothetical protein
MDDLKEKVSCSSQDLYGLQRGERIAVVAGSEQRRSSGNVEREKKKDAVVQPATAMVSYQRRMYFCK